MTMDELMKEFEKFNLALPVYMYEHSGITISVSRGYPYNDGWDSGQLGFIFVSHDDIRKEFGGKLHRLTKEAVAKAEKLLRSEIESYDDYLTGRVYGFVIKDEEDEILDSCWGFYGDYEKDCLLEARSSADYFAKERDNELAKIDKRMIAVSEKEM